MAFRVDAEGRLTAFAGGGSREITVDGKRTLFAEQPVDSIGWAPVAAMRRVPGGAVLQIKVRGAGTVHIPVADVKAPLALVAEGDKPGSRGQSVPATQEQGVLTFQLTPELNGRWLYAVARP
jgi:hypothetical protein